MSNGISLERQIRCVKREIKKREGVYPRWVGQGRMTKAEANDELEAMRAVLRTLQEADAASGLPLA